MVLNNILLVDKELLSRDLLTNHLKQNGFRVFAAESCTEAGKLISRNRFRLAIINSRLGEKETGEIISRLRKGEPGVLIYLLLPQPTVLDAENMARRGIHDTIVKPFRLDEVKTKLSRGVELLTLRQTVHRLSERVRVLEKKLISYQEVEEEVKIPDLSELEVDVNDLPPPESGETGGGLKSGAMEGGIPDELVLPGGKNSRGADAIEQIRRLDELRLAGILTEKEFNIKKKDLLKRI
ncbi:MAG: response regulator [bacterium]